VRYPFQVGIRTGIKRERASGRLNVILQNIRSPLFLFQMESEIIVELQCRFVHLQNCQLERCLAKFPCQFGGMAQYETSNAHSSVERMACQNTDEYCICSFLKRNEADNSLAYSNKASWRSEKIDFCEKNVGDNDESGDGTGFNRPRCASSEI
jgi:hypothetical protein